MKYLINNFKIIKSFYNNYLIYDYKLNLKIKYKNFL